MNCTLHYFPCHVGPFASRWTSASHPVLLPSRPLQWNTTRKYLHSDFWTPQLLTDVTTAPVWNIWFWTVRWCIHPGRSRCSSYCPTDSWQRSGQTDASFFFSLDWVLGGCHINTTNPLSVPLSPSVEWSVLIMYITVPNKGYFLPAEDRGRQGKRGSCSRVQVQLSAECPRRSSEATV